MGWVSAKTPHGLEDAQLCPIGGAASSSSSFPHPPFCPTSQDFSFHLSPIKVKWPKTLFFTSPRMAADTLPA